MASFNKVILMGNLTAEPELRYIQGSNTAICEFSLAINHKYRTSDGNAKEDVCFVEIVVWGKQAEGCQRYLQKGSSVLIEGRLVYEQWTERDTQKKRSRLRVNADKVQYMTNTRQVASDQQQGNPQQRQQSQYQQHPGISGGNRRAEGHKYPKEDVPQYSAPPEVDMPEMPDPADDDIPF